MRMWERALILMVVLAVAAWVWVCLDIAWPAHLRSVG